MSFIMAAFLRPPAMLGETVVATSSIEGLVCFPCEDSTDCILFEVAAVN